MPIELVPSADAPDSISRKDTGADLAVPDCAVAAEVDVVDLGVTRTPSLLHAVGQRYANVSLVHENT